MKSLFPTLIGQGKLPKFSPLNQALLKDISDLSQEDVAGHSWSKTNYRGGYTSYASLHDLHRRAPSFQAFEDALQGPVLAFAKAQGWTTKGRSLVMSDCWMNLMPSGTYHTLHFHPHSVISGTYYVQVPPDSVAIKLEDPRMPLYMSAPDRKEGLYHHVAPKVGEYLLFESWVRHEVPPNRSKAVRVSLSFNYHFE